MLRENPEGDPALSVPSVALSGAVLGFFRGRCSLPHNYTRKQNSREIFPAHFWSLFRIFGPQVTCAHQKGSLAAKINCVDLSKQTFSLGTGGTGVLGVGTGGWGIIHGDVVQ